MGTSRSAAEFSRKITRAATATQTRRKITVSEAALTAKEIVVATAASRGVTQQSRIAGARWAVRYDVKGFNDPAALLKVVGPFHLVESDTRAHKIYRRVARVKGRGSSRLNRQAKFDQVFGGKGAYKGGSLKLADGTYRKVVNHPGTSGKNIWSDSKKVIGRAVPRVMAQRITAGWREAFR